MSRPWMVLEQPDCFQKVFDESGEGQDAFFREVFFYTYYHDFTPRLLEANHLSMSIEKCSPLISPSGLYQGDPVVDPIVLWNLLVELGQRGGRHGDVSLLNVVRHPVRGLLLIDWEKATLSRGPSQDLFPHPSQTPLICWDGPWSFSPRRVFGISAQEMAERHKDPR